MKSVFINIERVCYKLGLDLEQRGELLTCLCPFHSEERPSFTVYTETNSWFCFSCNTGGGPLQLVSLLVEGVANWQDLVLWFQSGTDAFEQTGFRVSPPVGKIRDLLHLDATVVLPKSSRSSDPFLASLGVLYAREGEFAGRHIIPVRLNGDLVAYEARDFTGGLVPKTLIMPRGVRIRSFLWNIDSIEPGSSVIIVEGIKGAIAVMDFGYLNVVSSFGAKLSADQVALLVSRHPREVIIAYDADDAGIEGSSEAVANMFAWTNVYCVNLPEGTDPWDVSKDCWNTCLDNKARVLATDRNRMALSALRERIFC